MDIRRTEEHVFSKLAVREVASGTNLFLGIDDTADKLRYARECLVDIDGTISETESLANRNVNVNYTVAIYGRESIIFVVNNNVLRVNETVCAP
jgi:hypothetical protein